MGWVSDLQRVKAARKEHRCFWCGMRIDIGQPYSRWFSRGDGPYTTRVHPECHAAWERAIALDNEYRYGVHEATHTRGCICDQEETRCPDCAARTRGEVSDGRTDPIQAG